MSFLSWVTSILFLLKMYTCCMGWWKSALISMFTIVIKMNKIIIQRQYIVNVLIRGWILVKWMIFFYRLMRSFITFSTISTTSEKLNTSSQIGSILTNIKPNLSHIPFWSNKWLISTLGTLIISTIQPYVIWITTCLFWTRSSSMMSKNTWP